MQQRKMTHTQVRDSMIGDDTWGDMGSLFQGMQVVYVGKGALLGGVKERTGVLMLRHDSRNLRLVLWRESVGGEAKFYALVKECQVSKMDRATLASKGSALLLAANGKSTEISFATSTMQSEWFEKFNRFKQLITAGDKDNKLRFATSSQDVLYQGPTQVLFFGNDHKTVSLVAKKHLDAKLPYFEILVRNNGVFGLGLCQGTQRKPGMPGWHLHEIGYHGDDGNIFCEDGEGSSFGSTFAANDRVGCGIFFKDGKANQVFFVLNGEVVGTRPWTGGIYPVICGHSNAVKDTSPCRVEVLLERAVPSTILKAVESFSSRIKVHGPGAQDAYFSDLADALSNACLRVSQSGQTVTLSAGTYLVTKTIAVPHAVTIKGAGKGETSVHAAQECKPFIFTLQKACISDLTLHGNSDCSAVIHIMDCDMQNCRILTPRSSGPEVCLHDLMQRGELETMKVGSKVELTKDYAQYADARAGPLMPCQIGEVIVVDHSDCPPGCPIKVKGPSGKAWWYSAKAVKPQEVTGGTAIVSHNGRLRCADCEIGPCAGNGISVYSKVADADGDVEVLNTQFTMCADIGVKFQRRNATLRIENCEMQFCGLSILCSAEKDASKSKELPPKLLLQTTKIVGKRVAREEYENCTGLVVDEGSEAEVTACKFIEHYKAIQINSNSKLVGTDTSVSGCEGSCIFAKGENSVVNIQSWSLAQSGEKKRNAKTAGLFATDGACAHLKACEFTDCRSAGIIASHNGTIFHSDSKFLSCAEKEDKYEGGKIAAL
jgi:hypothetical protein